MQLPSSVAWDLAVRPSLVPFSLCTQSLPSPPAGLLDTDETDQPYACHIWIHTDKPVLADRIGAYNSHILGNIIFVLMYFIWLACKDLGSLIALVVILGIAGGSFVTLQPPLAVMTATDMRYAGTYVGQSMCTFISAYLPNLCRVDARREHHLSCGR